MFSKSILRPILVTRRIFKRVTEIPSRGLPNFFGRADDDFDLKYGVETAKIVRITLTNSPNWLDGTRYEASSETAIRWSIENCGLALPDTTFVDVGCGKGRALVVAATYPFKKIVGVEYSPELAGVCRQNLAKRQIEDRCEVAVGDAVDYVFPIGDVLAFFYNPFGEVVHLRVLDNLTKTEGRVRIAHIGPGHDVVRKSGVAHEMASGESGVRLYTVLRKVRT
jgi:predicted RNA methylase